MIKSRAFRPAALLGTMSLVLAGCSMPSMPSLPGMGGYYAVTDPAGTVYYTNGLRQEKQGVVEFRDGATGAWVSVARAEVRSISSDEYKAGIRR